MGVVSLVARLYNWMYLKNERGLLIHETLKSDILTADSDAITFDQIDIPLNIFDF